MEPFLLGQYLVFSLLIDFYDQGQPKWANLHWHASGKWSKTSQCTISDQLMQTSEQIW